MRAECAAAGAPRLALQPTRSTPTRTAADKIFEAGRMLILRTSSCCQADVTVQAVRGLRICCRLCSRLPGRNDDPELQVRMGREPAAAPCLAEERFILPACRVLRDVDISPIDDSDNASMVDMSPALMEPLSKDDVSGLGIIRELQKIRSLAIEEIRQIKRVSPRAAGDSINGRMELVPVFVVVPLKEGRRS